MKDNEKEMQAFYPQLNINDLLKDETPGSEPYIFS